MMNKIDTEILQKAWYKAYAGHNRVKVFPLDDSGNYAKLAAYFIKYSDKHLKDGDSGKLQGKRWAASKNLVRPEPVYEIVTQRAWFRCEAKDAQENTHQKLEGIEELADNFLTVGQEQPTVLARVNGEFRIIDGHRRNAANIFNIERGYKEYEKIKYRYKDMSEAMYELRLLAGNGYRRVYTVCMAVRFWSYRSTGRRWV